ncbi:hypothetical protein BCL80_11585 [Streptomyces avidinii]|jgi:hypothetical protein|nr:hypothetical protein [Streptomyces pratensis]RAS23987.1 hypothetical protein BCL80_11585 [Streptomyces avidinii]SNX80890.1 hypothetical protein SAMN05421860_11385 [Streptomyces microflavus]
MELRNITRRGRCAQRSGMTVSAHAGHARSSSRVKFPVLLAIPPARPPNGDRTPWCRPSIRKGPVPCREPTGSAPLVPARPELEAGREQNTPGNGEMTVAQRTDNSSCAAPVASTRPACAATWDTRLEPFRPVNDTSRRPVPPPHPAPLASQLVLPICGEACARRRFRPSGVVVVPARAADAEAPTGACDGDVPDRKHLTRCTGKGTADRTGRAERLGLHPGFATPDREQAYAQICVQVLIVYCPASSNSTVVSGHSFASSSRVPRSF